MTTRQELLDGVAMIIREGQRTTAAFGPNDWSYKIHAEEGGWTVKQIYSHLASTAEVMPMLVGALEQTGEGQNAAANLDVNQFNAQGVAQRESLSEKELLDAFKTSYEKAAEYLKTVPEEKLQMTRRFGQIEAPVAELIDTYFVLHALGHIYNCTSRPLN